MNYHVCTISFRHELVSLRELLQFTKRNGFAGIELWGVHGLSLMRQNPCEIPLLAEEVRELGIGISMISHYLDLNAHPDRFEAAERQWNELIRLAKAFGADKIRIFAGNSGSAASSRSDWNLVVKRLRAIADQSSNHGIYTLIETHPDTYADRLDSTLRLVEETNHAYIGINLDFLHLWESGTAPLKAWRSLKHTIKHFHLKNVLDSSSLRIFDPHNIYSPSGTRSGIVSLAEGAVDYSGIIPLLASEDSGYSASIEWFGSDPFRYLKEEMLWLKEREKVAPSKLYR